MALMRKATFWGAYSTANFDHENFNLIFGVREWVPPLDSILTLEVVTEGSMISISESDNWHSD